MLLQIFLEAGETNRKLRKLWCIEDHHAAAAIGDDIGAEQFARGFIVEAVTDVAAELGRIVGETR